jgi:hypothetical protein
MSRFDEMVGYWTDPGEVGDAERENRAWRRQMRKQRREDFWFSGWGFLTGFVLIVALVVGLTMTGVYFSNRSAERACVRLGETTGNETKWVGPALDGSCYVRVDERWIPVGAWKVES